MNFYNAVAVTAAAALAVTVSSKEQTVNLDQISNSGFSGNLQWKGSYTVTDQLTGGQTIQDILTTTQTTTIGEPLVADDDFVDYIVCAGEETSTSVSCAIWTWKKKYVSVEISTGNSFPTSKADITDMVYKNGEVDSVFQNNDDHQSYVRWSSSTEAVNGVFTNDDYDLIGAETKWSADNKTGTAVQRVTKTTILTKAQVDATKAFAEALSSSNVVAVAVTPTAKPKTKVTVGLDSTFSDVQFSTQTFASNPADLTSCLKDPNCADFSGAAGLAATLGAAAVAVAALAF